ncbi:cyclic nucleotide-gated channel cone photoreceptor subunit alpha isoform X2 [Nematostella vectensis]|nr:cyclic nucleotide-gated channel cone photoreceptor subunit alpha isoform X2 [Nematostella vectensis]
MQRFYSNSGRMPRDTWLEKYTYRRATDDWDWRRPLMRMTPSPTSQPPSPALEKLGSAQNAPDIEAEPADLPRSRCIPLVLDPSGTFYFLWLLTVSLGVIYNYWALIVYVAFPSVHKANLKTCIAVDYTFDSIFFLDTLVQFRVGFLEHGVMVVGCWKLTKKYGCSFGFMLDLISILPFDVLYLYLGVLPILRFNRLFKAHRFLLFCDRGEIYSGRPKLFNLAKLIHYLFLIIHWVACVYFILSRYEGFGTDEWLHPRLDGQLSKLSMQYLYSLYRSSVSMTTVGAGVIGTIATPRTELTLCFVIVTYLTGVLIFATIVGNAGDMIVEMRRSRERYLRKLNGMKEYIEAYQLPAHLKKRVIHWFDYLWRHKRDMNEQELFHKLNDNFKAEIAIHVNLDTLIRVEMFHDCDPGFLHELVLKLRPVICSPGDFICRQGEKGREMYIVNKGSLEVLDEKETVLATLSAGSHFGEISLLNMKGIGNLRTASVRSVGFSDLFQLSKTDLEEVLEFYPQAKEQMERIATQTYEKQQRERMGQSKSKEDDADETFLRESDPRKWLAADTKTLRRRLSSIESINTLKKFAARVRRERELGGPQVEGPRDVLRRFAQKAREKRSDEESRKIVNDFVETIREREAKELEESFKSGGTSSESLFSLQMKSRILKNRFSYSGSERETDTSHTRPRSLSLAHPRDSSGSTPALETLAVPPKPTLAKLASYDVNRDVKVKPRVYALKVFGKAKLRDERPLEPSKPTRAQRPTVLPLPNTSLNYRLADSVAAKLCEENQRLKMERKRKWFEAATKVNEEGRKMGRDGRECGHNWPAIAIVNKSAVCAEGIEEEKRKKKEKEIGTVEQTDSYKLQVISHEGEKDGVAEREKDDASKIKSKEVQVESGNRKNSDQQNGKQTKENIHKKNNPVEESYPGKPRVNNNDYNNTTTEQSVKTKQTKQQETEGRRESKKNSSGKQKNVPTALAESMHCSCSLPLKTQVSDQASKGREIPGKEKEEQETKETELANDPQDKDVPVAVKDEQTDTCC